MQAGLANRELGGVNTHGQAMRTRIQVVTTERPLASLVKPSLRIERERMGRNRETLPQQGTHGLNLCGGGAHGLTKFRTGQKEQPLVRARDAGRSEGHSSKWPLARKTPLPQ